MIPFDTVLRAHLPFIGVHYDDPVNVRLVLQSIAKKPVQPLPTLKQVPVGNSYLYWTEDSKAVTTEMYRRLTETTASAVVINPGSSNMLVFDVGTLPTPDSFYQSYLQEFVEGSQIPALIQALQGLSVKAAQEVVQITMARTGAILPQEVRKTRQVIAGNHPGLIPLDTEYDFYEWPASLKAWVALNEAYFLTPHIPQVLVPRGILLAGPPGVGKSMAARVLAKHWDVPLFRLDISTSLTRFLGESEARIARNLEAIEQSSPAILLLDEAEKLFGTQGDEGTTQRILSQILWWLQAHKARVLTVMTTNNLDILPKELYRAERLDRVITLEKMNQTQARAFAARVYHVVLGTVPPPKRMKQIREALGAGPSTYHAHAEVRVVVYDLIKTHGWLAAP